MRGLNKHYVIMLITYKYLSLFLIFNCMNSKNNKPSLDEFPDVFVKTEAFPENTFDLITLSDAKHVVGVATNNEEKKFIGWTIPE